MMMMLLIHDSNRRHDQPQLHHPLCLEKKDIHASCIKLFVEGACLQLVVAGLLTLATSSAVKLRGDGVGNAGELLELLVEVLGGGRSGVLLKPVLSLLDSLSDGLLVLLVDLATETVIIVHLVLQVVRVVLEFVSGLDALTGGLVLIGVLFGFLNHTLNFLSGETALVVGDSDALSLTGTLVNGRNLEDTVGIELEGNLDLGNATRCRGNVGELELAKLVAVKS